LTAGRASNRSAKTETAPGGSAVSVSYCYDNADRVISTTDPALAGTWGYDARGNTTAMVGETRSYDASDRHRRTEKGSVWVAYTRDVTDRIVQRQTSDPADPVVRYSYSASGDTADLTLNGSNQVIEATIGLPGGVLYTYKPATPASSVWSYPNLAGSVVAVANQAGVKQGATRWWDPDGNPLGATAVPDNSAGAFDYGWLGGHQRPVEQLAGLVATVQMGARQYVPRLGRFLQVDPVEGGGANDYAYPHDPVNMSDLDGKFWKCKWCRKAWNRGKAAFHKTPLGVGLRNARAVGRWVRRNPAQAFGIAVGVGCIFATAGAAAGLCVAAGFAIAANNSYQSFRRNGGVRGTFWRDTAVGFATAGLMGAGSGFRSWAVNAHQKAWGVRLSRRMQWGMNLGPQSVATTCASIRRARC
jgi:RHS repeat-associated protein